MRRVLAVILINLTLLLPEVGQANVPAAFFACEDAMEGEPCALPGPVHGACLLDTLCEDNEVTQVNECLLCVDECWVLEEGLPCTRRDGLPGSCVEQSPCTPDPEKSFHVCLRCSTPTVAPVSSGCTQSSGLPAIPWLMLIGWAGWARRKRTRI